MVFSPSDDAYYHWLMVIGAAVFYNWTLLVVRLGTIIVLLLVLCIVFCGWDVQELLCEKTNIWPLEK